jgi:hypothetical protein
MLCNRTLSILALSCVVTACDGIDQSPKLIVADGTTHIACQGLVWSGTESGGLLGGSTSLKVSFTDAEGLDHTIRGIKSLSVSDLPKSVPAPMPYPLPNAQLGTDSNGKNFVSGVPYTWPDGSQATLQNGAWKPVMRPNDACTPNR